MRAGSGLFRLSASAVIEPEGADVLDGLLPGLVLGLGDDGSPFMALGRIDGRGDTAERRSVVRRSRQGLNSPQADWALELPDVGMVSILGAELELVEGERPRMLITGRIRTQEVVDLLVGVGGFEREGARKIVAETLGYTVETLPAELPFRILANGEAG